MHSPIVFAATFEGLYLKGLGSELTPAVAAALKAQGVELEHLRAGYPLSVWKVCLKATAEVLFPELTLDQAYAQLGCRFADGYLKTPLGMGLRYLLQALGPDRMMRRLGWSMRWGNNFSRVEGKEVRPQVWEIWINDVFADQPGFLTGLLERGLGHTGVRDVRLTTLEFDGAGGRFGVEWSRA